MKKPRIIIEDLPRNTRAATPRPKGRDAFPDGLKGKPAKPPLPPTDETAPEDKPREPV